MFGSAEVGPPSWQLWLCALMFGGVGAFLKYSSEHWEPHRDRAGTAAMIMHLAILGLWTLAVFCVVLGVMSVVRRSRGAGHAP